MVSSCLKVAKKAHGSNKLTFLHCHRFKRGVLVLLILPANIMKYQSSANNCDISDWFCFHFWSWWMIETQRPGGQITIIPWSLYLALQIMIKFNKYANSFYCCILSVSLKAHMPFNKYMSGCIPHSPNKIQQCSKM